MGDIEDEPTRLAGAVNETPPPPPPVSAAESRDVMMEESGTVRTSYSNRMRLIPPDGKPKSWFARHARELAVAEWALAAGFFLVALYFIWQIWFAIPERPAAQVVDVPPPPSREEFRKRIREMAPPVPAAAWKVEARVGRWRAIVIHHSATEFGNPETFDRFHREVRKWENGLGYHFVIGNGQGMEDGEVAVGHRWTEQLDGAHVKGDGSNPNSFSIGIALVGDFEKGQPTARQLASLKGLLAFLRTEYGIGLAAISGHKDVSSTPTECPGMWFFVDEVVLALANP